MISDNRFKEMRKDFWADVRLIGQQVGYTLRGSGQVKVAEPWEIIKAYKEMGLSAKHLFGNKERPTKLGSLLLGYLSYRANVLNTRVEKLLMDGPEAKRIYEELAAKYKPGCPIPMNKQKGEKRAPAFFTGIINILIEANARGKPCDYDPRTLTTITSGRRPLRMFARRIDGAFPSSIDPVAVWEIKEYYYTTTFGSRVADGVYESLLDGMELEELRTNERIDVKHYLMLDSHYTWWGCGRSYLCRIIDLLHMGYVDEVLFGREVLSRLPLIVKGWLEVMKSRSLERKKLGETE